MFAFVLLVLAQSGASGAFGGQTNHGTGGLLRTNQYATQAPLALFVDPTGSDANDCTTTGASACLTVQGAYDKIPELVRHPVTISLAAGNLAGGVLHSKRYVPATASGAYVATVGTLITFSPATGTATGTATSATQCTEAAPQVKATVTDGTQTWTTNNLRGFLIETTGGTGSGQITPIASNSGTVITLAGCWVTTPDATTTYAIRTWASTIISGPTIPADYLNTAGATQTGLVFENVEGERGRGNSVNDGVVFVDSVWVTVANALWVESSHVNVRRSRLDATSATGLGIQVEGSYPRLTIQNSVATATSSWALFQQSPNTSWSTHPSTGTSMAIGNSYFQSGTTTVGGVFFGMPGVKISNATVTMTSASAPFAVYMNGLSTNDWFVDLNVNCTAGSTTGIFADTGYHGTSLGSTEVGVEIDDGTISECGTSILSTGPRSWIALQHSPTFQATAGTSALNVSAGGHILTHSSANISGSFTQEVLFESAPYTLATAVNGLISSTGAAVFVQ